jgi:hypothetical protein
MATIDPAESERRLQVLRQQSPLAPRIENRDGLTTVGSYSELARPVVTRSGDWSTDRAEVVGSDVTHLPLNTPGYWGSAPSSVPAAPPPPAPTEQQLRAALEQAKASASFAADNLARAQASHDRALAHVRHCDERVHGFDDLDDQIAADLTTQLTAGGVFKPETPARLRAMQAGRETARSDVKASETALNTLAAVLADARDEAAAAAQAARKAAAALSLIEAERLAERVLELEAEAQRLRELVLAADVAGVSAHGEFVPVYGPEVRDDPIPAWLVPAPRPVWTPVFDYRSQPVDPSFHANQRAIIEVMQEQIARWFAVVPQQPRLDKQQSQAFIGPPTPVPAPHAKEPQPPFVPATPTPGAMPLQQTFPEGDRTLGRLRWQYGGLSARTRRTIDFLTWCKQAA